jgi:DNA-binding response OmpR family regulator
MKKILIVDDDEHIARALAVRLTVAGYHTFTAPDPAFAVMFVGMHRPDLVIMDICLPIMEGFGLAHRLNGMHVGRIPVIFITASREPGLRESAMRMGAAGFFEKPYDADELLRAVRQALQEPPGRIAGASHEPVTRAAH